MKINYFLSSLFICLFISQFSFAQLIKDAPRQGPLQEAKIGSPSTLNTANKVKAVNLKLSANGSVIEFSQATMTKDANFIYKAKVDGQTRVLKYIPNPDQNRLTLVVGSSLSQQHIRVEYYIPPFQNGTPHARVYKGNLLVGSSQKIGNKLKLDLSKAQLDKRSALLLAKLHDSSASSINPSNLFGDEIAEYDATKGGGFGVKLDKFLETFKKVLDAIEAVVDIFKKEDEDGSGGNEGSDDNDGDREDGEEEEEEDEPVGGDDEGRSTERPNPPNRP